MATFTITANKNIDELASKAGGDTYAINGAKLTIDQDSRYGLNNNTSSSLPSLPISATLGGIISIDARYVRLIPFNSGSGTVPASNTIISQGGASGKLIGVYSALNTAPLAAAAAMPTSGYIKIKQWNSVEYAAGALTGITANATGISIVGWIEIVGDELATVTVPRLGLFEMLGEWYDLGTTTGANTGTYQIPTNGSITYVPAVWVETGTGTGIYEAYPCAGTLTALATNVSTDAIRGKICWISTAGVLRFQNDGTNSAGGYLPPAGRKIRIPNIITANCTTAARTANVLPNATLATRYDFTVTGGGVVNIDKVCLNWYPSYAQAYSVQINNTCIAEQIAISEIASPMNWSNVCVGQSAAQAQLALSMALCFAGGTFNNCVWSSASLAVSGRYVTSLTDISGFTFDGDETFSLVGRGNATSGASVMTRVANCTWNNPTINGRLYMTTCSSLNYTNTTYYDHPVTTTPTAYPMNMFDLFIQCTDITIDGISFGGLTGVQPYTSILAIGAAGCKNIKLRNLGTPASPLSMGAATVHGATWATAGSTTVTVTSTAHKLKTNDIIYVIISSNTGVITVGTKTITVTGVNTFTFVGVSSTSSGTLSYELTMCAYLLNIAAGAAANNIKVQRCYVPQLRTGLWTGDNSSKNIFLESCRGPEYLGQVSAILNGYAKNLGVTHTMSAQTAVYGTHWFDSYIWPVSANLATQSWTRSSTTATVTSVNHGMMTGAQISVTVTSDAAAIVLGQKSITVLTKDTFTFTCLAAGSTSGTLTYTVANGRIGILANEATSDTSQQYAIDSGTPAFTSAGGLYMPTIGQQITFTRPDNIIGHSSFPIMEAVMAGGTIGNYDISYALDQGSGYGSFHNLYYPRPGGSGSSGAFTFTVTSAIGIEIGDYVWGTGIGMTARVTGIATNTVTVNIANTATVSGIIRFNHLPFESVIDTAIGFNMKIRIKTSTTNTTAITSLYAFTFSDATARSKQYVLDPIYANVSITSLVPGTQIHVYRTSDMAELAATNSSGTSFIWNYLADNTNVYITMIKLGLVFNRYENLTLSQSGINIIATQETDLAYNNPA